MAPTHHVQRRSKIDQARQFLARGAVHREDSDDELGYEDHPWEWIYEDIDASHVSQNITPRKRKAAASSPLGRHIISARMGNFQCKLGDAVFLKAEGSQAWVGIITEFFDDKDEGEKMARFVWFSSEKEIRDKTTKRTDFLPVCLFCTSHTNNI